jgi:UDP-N-acetylglucosamine 1-carboxyvinyltransferase
VEKIIIEGGKKLQGTVSLSGAKNAALALLPATLLAEEECTLNNIPHLRDVYTMTRVLGTLGLKVEIDESRVRIEPSASPSYEAPYEMVKTMRASILVLGPLLAKFGKARVSLPGGCAIGLRPIDLHMKGLRELGAKIDIRHGYIEAEALQLKGTKIYLDRLSVGATENLMMVGVRAKGKTVIENADKSPEIEDLANFLNKMGAKISGAGTDTIEIEGVKSLKGCDYTIIPDRIEAGTFMVAAAITGGDIKIEKVIPEHSESLIKKLEEAGVEIRLEARGLRVRAPQGVKAVNPICSPR